MANARLSFLFYRYVNDNCSEGERQELLRLLADPANDEQVKVLMAELWDHVPGKELSAQDSDRIFDRIITERKSPPFSWLRMAAVFVIMVLSALAVVYFRAGYRKPNIAREMDEEAKTKFVTLPDGSTVVLNAGSTLDYTPSFGGKVREVVLTGEGFFDVEHDSLKPFVVHTGKLRTTVLGTAFNIKAYADQEIIIVTVTRGKVRVSDDRHVLGVLHRDEQISVDRRQAAERKPVDSHRVTEWIQRDILFDDVTIAEAILELEKRFQVSIIMADEEIAHCRFTATFVQGEGLKQILEILCDFNNATLSANEAGGFVISGGDCR